MRDNPMATAVLQGDSAYRERKLARSFKALLDHRPDLPFGAIRDGVVIGIAGFASPGHCQTSFADTVRMAAQVRTGPAAMRRALIWSADWAKRDIDEPHWHLGPVSVDAGLKGLGLGSRMMQAFAEMMDERAGVAYLETELPENVGFYNRFGFEVIQEAAVLGVRTWFMRRDPV